MDEKVVEQSMQLILHSGTGRSMAIEAVRNLMKDGDSETAKKKISEAGKEIGKEIGQRQANIAAIKNMIIRFQATKEVILEDYTESEYNTAIAELQSESR